MFNTDLWSLVTNTHNHVWPPCQGLVHTIYIHHINMKPFKKHQCSIIAADPFGGDPFKEADPFKASSEDFFKKTTKMDPFSTADPFSKSATLPTKVPVHSEDWSQSKTKKSQLTLSIHQQQPKAFWDEHHGIMIIYDTLSENQRKPLKTESLLFL